MHGKELGFVERLTCESQDFRQAQRISLNAHTGIGRCMKQTRAGEPGISASRENVRAEE
jgi:hypothetical protein